MSGFIPVVQAGRGGITAPELTKDYGKGAVLTIRAEVEHLQGGAQDPHFSVTCEVVTDQSRRHRDIQAGGCMHEEALRYWPELAPIVALHLSSAKTGAPMHAESNGWYFLAGYFGGLGERYHFGNTTPAHTPAECLRVFAEHVRISEAEAEQLARTIAATEPGHCPRCSGVGLENGKACPDCTGSGIEAARLAYRRGWSLACAGMRERWQRECLQGLAWLLEHATPPDLRVEWFKRTPEYTGHSIAELAAAGAGVAP